MWQIFIGVCQKRVLEGVSLTFLFELHLASRKRFFFFEYIIVVKIILPFYLNDNVTQITLLQN
jgi:hypothetical protein